MDATEMMSDEGWVFLYEHVPHWYAKLEGPIPEGGEQRVVLQLDYMVFPTREAVEENIWLHVELMCDQVEWEYDPAQWDLLHLVAINAN